MSTPEEREIDRLRKGLETAWAILNYTGPTNEYMQWARDVCVQALGGVPKPVVQGRPYYAAKLFIGDDYPVDGWEDGMRPEKGVE